MRTRRRLLNSAGLSGARLGTLAPTPIAQLLPREPHPAAGLFAEDSVLRRVHGEGLLLLGGGRALLMQIAHSQVAAGVAEHSGFRGDRAGRLLRTLRPVYAITFGSTEQARAAAAQVHGRHRGVVGEGYRALDPELLLWVHATLVDTALVVYERFVRPLANEEREAYYRDTLTMAELWGLDASEVPSSFRELRAYVDGMVAGLDVSPTARGLAREIFRPRPLRMAPLLLTARELTTGLLPPRLRREFGLGWGVERGAALEVASALARASVPYLPRALRWPPGLLLPGRPAEECGAARRAPNRRG